MAVGQVNLANLYDSAGHHHTNMTGIGLFSVENKGFMTPDKKVVIGMETNAEPGFTNYDPSVFTTPGQTYNTTASPGSGRRQPPSTRRGSGHCRMGFPPRHH